MPKMPTIFIPHGGGPCFFMEWSMGPRDTWEPMRDFLATYPTTLPQKPTALLVVSGHWEERRPTVNRQPAPPLYFDYHGFPPHTYELTWPAPGSPALAERTATLLAAAGFAPGADDRRGLDHGVFVPLKVMFPGAEVPVVQLSLKHGLDPAEHLRMGEALAPLRDEGVLIVGSGMSFHNMGAFMRPQALEGSQIFDRWLTEAVGETGDARERALAAWAVAPAGRFAHPREEHLVPLMVTAGAARGEPGNKIFEDVVMGAQISAFEFGGAPV